MMPKLLSNTSQGSLEGFNIWVEMAEVRIHEFEEKAKQIIQFEEEREKIWKQNEQSLSNLWENIKLSNICN